MKTGSALLAALFAGIALSEVAARSATVRDGLGRLFGRGHLVTLVHQHAIYEADLSDGPSAQELIAAENIRWLARDEAVDTAATEREFSLLKAEFKDDAAFSRAARANWFFFSRCLRAAVRENLQARSWIERKISEGASISEDESRRLYETRRDSFNAPVRYRVSHIFVAAPDGYPTDLIETKRQNIETLAAQLKSGADFSALAAQFSEDEATKTKGGDLNYFAATRMMPEFFAAISNLKPGQISGPIRSRLGFHIARLTEVKPAAALSFEEGRPEIEHYLGNQRRRQAIERLAMQFSAPQ